MTGSGEEIRRFRNASFLLAAGGICFFSGIFPFFMTGIRPLVPNWVFLLLSTVPVQAWYIASGVVPALRHLPGIPLRKTLDLGPVRGRDLAWFLPGTALVYLLLGLLTGSMVHLLRKAGLPVQEQPVLELFRNGSPAERGILVFTALFLAPAGEEICFRFAVFRDLENRVRTVPAALMSALLFSAAHLNVQVFPSLFLLSLWLTALYRKTGSLPAPMAAHALFNGITFVVLLLCGP